MGVKGEVVIRSEYNSSHKAKKGIVYLCHAALI